MQKTTRQTANRKLLIGLTGASILCGVIVTALNVGTGWVTELISLAMPKTTLPDSLQINALVGLAAFLAVWLGGGIAYALARVGSGAFQYVLIATCFVLMPLLFVGQVMRPSLDFWLGPFLSSPDWKALPPLPEKAVEVLGADMQMVFVRGASGNTYSCETFTTPKNCWTEMPAKTNPHNGEHVIEIKAGDEVPAGAVNTLAIQYYPVPEAATRVFYAVMPDGSVWWWKSEGQHALVILFGWIFPLIAAVGAFAALGPYFLGAGIVVVMRQRQRA